MLKALFFCVKITVLAVVVLVLGNYFRWDGKTISDQVKTKMSHAEQSNVVSSVRDWADRVTHDARKGLQKKISHNGTTSMTVDVPEEITASERQKLKALIQELNSSHRKD